MLGVTNCSGELEETGCPRVDWPEVPGGELLQVGAGGGVSEGLLSIDQAAGLVTLDYLDSGGHTRRVTWTITARSRM